jgi:hypothetical protein
MRSILACSLGAGLLVACSAPAVQSTSAANVSAEAEPLSREPTRFVFALGGFSTPEAVIADPDGDHYLVSNVEGSPTDRDENGFISKVSTEGEMIDSHFIRGGDPGHGLSAPKGMAISGEKLFVADIDRVFVFHRKTGAVLSEVPISGATFLNAVAVGRDGEVYVSDSGLVLGEEGFSASGSDAIHVLRDGLEPEILVKDPSLGRPNGLLFTDEGLWVVTFGTGELYRVDGEGEIHDRRSLPHGTLDGIVALGDGRFAISSWEAESVLVGDPRGDFVPLITGVKSPAAIGWDGTRGRLLVPLFMHDEVRAYDVAPRSVEAGAP